RDSFTTRLTAAIGLRPCLPSAFRHFRSTRFVRHDIAQQGLLTLTTMPPTYWLDLFTGATWQEFLDAGGKVSGFRPSKWKALKKVKVGDVLLCYLTGVSRWIGALEVTSRPFRDHAPIWKDEDFP